MPNYSFKWCHINKLAFILQEFLPAVAMPLTLCVMLEDFTIDEIPGKEQQHAQHLITLQYD